MRLSDAGSGGFYKILSIAGVDLERKLGAYGIFSGSVISKVSKGDIELNTLKIITKDGTKALSGSLARHIFYKSPSNEKRSIYEHAVGEWFPVVVPRIAAPDMNALGIKRGDLIQVVKKLPHMEYIALIDHRVRCRLSEAHAACLIGKGRQFSFAGKGVGFVVEEIISLDTYSEVMSVNGIHRGTVMVLEGIESGKSVHMDEYPDMVLCTAEGLRVFIAMSTAEKITAE